MVIIMLFVDNGDNDNDNSDNSNDNDNNNDNDDIDCDNNTDKLNTYFFQVLWIQNTRGGAALRQNGLEFGDFPYTCSS